MENENTRTVRFKFTKTDEFKYLSHLDLLRIIARALVRAGIKAEFSKGFNPKPKVTMSDPIPLGVNSLAEYCDVTITGNVISEVFIEKLNNQLPSGLKVVKAAVVQKKLKGLMSRSAVVLYEFRAAFLKNQAGDVPYKIENGMAGKISKSILMEAEGADPLISGSIFDIDVEAGKEIIFLKIFGYVKIFKDKNNSIFKFNNFFEFLKNFLKQYNLYIEDAFKKELYFFEDSKLVTPLDSKEVLND